MLTLLRRYIESNPALAAQMLQTMDEGQAVAVVKSLPPALCADLVARLQISHAAAVLQNVSPETLSAIVSRIKPEQAMSILMSLTPEMRQTMLDLLPGTAKKEIQDLLQFPDNSAGRIMTTKFIALDQGLTVKEAVQRIRTIAHRYGPSTYTYVVDELEHLVGVLNMRDLMLAGGTEPISEIMHREVFTVDGFKDREEVAHELGKHKYLAAPVIDAERRLIGVVKMEQLLGHIQEEGTEDILKMVGAGSDERTFSPVFFALKKRLPWLTVNLATAFLAASVVGLFEDIIAKITVLAVFLPVVAGQGGNAGAQSLAVVMRGLVMREVRPQHAWKLIFKESTLGALNGLIIGIITAGVAWMWHGNPYLGVVIGLGMIVNLTAAGLSGAAIPLTMKALGWDPAQSSSIILTTVTDVVGFFAFLGFAVLFQARLM